LSARGNFPRWCTNGRRVASGVIAQRRQPLSPENRVVLRVSTLGQSVSLEIGSKFIHQVAPLGKKSGKNRRKGYVF